MWYVSLCKEKEKGSKGPLMILKVGRLRAVPGCMTEYRKRHDTHMILDLRGTKRCR